ncbi:MAG TPA: hypothetical protein VIS96_03540 [Terrimicrobiaceae bacterium]
MRATTTKLFDALTPRSVTLRDRLALSPMGQCEAEDGFVARYQAADFGRVDLWPPAEEIAA